MKKLTLLAMVAFLTFACSKREETAAMDSAGRTDTTVQVPTANMNEPGEPVATATTTPAIPNPATATPGTPATTPLPTATMAQPGDTVQRVPPQELNEHMRAGHAVVVDVRYAEQYQAAHIPGAIHIPLNEIGWRATELPRDKMIVAYCT